MINDFIAVFEDSVREYDCWRCASDDEVNESSEALEYIIAKGKQDVLLSLLVEEKELDAKIV